MSLQSAIKEVEKEERKALGVEEKVDAAPEIDDEVEDTEVKKDDTAEGSDTKADETEKKDDAAEPEKDAKPPESADFARLRREKAASDRRAAAAEAQLKQPPKPAEAAKPADKDPEPDQTTDPEAHFRWELRQAKSQLQSLNEWRKTEERKQEQVAIKDNAFKAFGSYEKAFRSTVTDYDDVTKFGVNAIATSIRTLNPSIEGEALSNAIQRQILRMAGEAEAQGHDPAEFLYHAAKSWGYQPKAAAEDEKGGDKSAETPKPDFRKIVESKKKSASALTPGGKNGKIPLSREAVLDKNFGLQDFARLTPEQLKEMETM